MTGRRDGMRNWDQFYGTIFSSASSTDFNEPYEEVQNDLIKSNLGEIGESIIKNEN